MKKWNYYKDFEDEKLTAHVKNKVFQFIKTDLSKENEPFAQAMNKLASRPSYAKKLGQNGRQLVVKHYTWEKVAKQMISLYKTL